MIKCREVPEDLHNLELSFKRRLGLRFHLLICPPCRALQRQWEEMDQRMRRWLHETPTPDANAELAKKIARDFLE